MNNDKIIEFEYENIENICNKYNYDNNIRELLHIIVPAFIIKYGMSKEKLILKVMNEVQILVNDTPNKRVMGYYKSIPKRIDNNIIINKFIMLNSYKDKDIILLLDTLVHELNHAVNSYLNPYRINKYLEVRIGITKILYDKDSLKPIKKDSSYILEEIINTKQTEEIIDIIKSFDNSNNCIYAINSETNTNYSSKSYLLESYICKNIMNNKTFIRTLEVVRLNGETDNINEWFDHIYGLDGTYKELILLLNKIIDIEKSINKNNFITKRIKLNKIRDYAKRVINIIDKFNENVVYN